MPPATDVSGMSTLLPLRGCGVGFGTGDAVAVAPGADFGDIGCQRGGAEPQDHIR